MKKILCGSAKHLELAGGIKGLDYLMLNLSNKCNYRCLKCCNSGRASSKQPLTSKEIFNLLDEVKALGARVLVVAGEGEPLVDNRINKIVAKADKVGLIPYIFTNGSLLSEKTARFFRKHNASLVINLDSLDERKYELLSGVNGSFAKVMDNLERVRDIFSNAYFTIKGFEVSQIAINTVVSRYNVLEAEQVKEFCGKDFVLVYNTPMNIGRASSDSSFRVDEELSKKIKALSAKTIPLGTTSDRNWCAYMRNGVSVGVDGEILACAYSLETAGKFGNVRQGKLSEYVGKANLTVDKFYKKKGHSRCILRHEDYSGFCG